MVGGSGTEFSNEIARCRPFRPSFPGSENLATRIAAKVNKLARQFEIGIKQRAKLNFSPKYMVFSFNFNL
jgi:hypothetical protein